MKKEFGNIVFLPGPNKGRYPYCHSVLVRDSVCAVIDPAADKELLSRVNQEEKVSAVILSHYHEDHRMYMGIFSDAELWVPHADAPPFEDLDLFMEWYGMTDPEEISAWKAVLRTQFNFRERTPERIFHDGQVLMVGRTPVQVVHTPGHTPGHCCFYFPEQQVLFLADIDLTRFGPWYGDKYSSIDDFIASVEKVRNIPARYFITAHEDGIFQEDPGDLWDEYLAVIDKREQKLKEFIRKPRTMEEIVQARIVYKKPREPKTFYDFAERVTMLKHLERMAEQGEVELNMGRYRLLE